MEIDKSLLIFNKSNIFTPDNISIMMAKYLNEYGNLLEPSVGSGQLIKHINISNYNSIDIFDINEEYINQYPKEKNINPHVADFIKYVFPINVKYDNIIMNPPYIRIQDLSVEYREYLKNEYKILQCGSIDYYYAFILKCISLLNENGIMVAITPNSYLYNKSAIPLREYLMKNKYIYKIIDFKDNKVFPNVSTYCCITIFKKNNETDNIIYNDTIIKYADINTDTYNIFDIKNIDKNITKLKDICNIRNGIATLRDSIYIHNIKLYDEPCWKIITNGYLDKWIIYPYDKNAKIIDETSFSKQNPQTYKYLQEHKNELDKRDKGKKQYATWYAYGRTQSLKLPNAKHVIYIPSFINPENYKPLIDTPKLFISSICIEPNDNVDVNYIVEVLKKNINYIKANCQKKSGGWITLTTTLLKNIPI